jgi:hypothetical protein
MTSTVLSRCSVTVVVPGWVCPVLQIVHCIMFNAVFSALGAERERFLRW